MAFSDYTTPDSVRAVLGISVKEAADSVIEDTVYLTGMLEALHKVSSTLATDYLDAKNTAPRSANQTRFVLLAETYCTYTVALQLIPNLPMAAPQIITDGKSAMNRVADPYKELKPSIVASLNYFRTNLVEAYAAINPAIVVPVTKKRIGVLASSLAVDPVTG